MNFTKIISTIFNTGNNTLSARKASLLFVIKMLHYCRRLEHGVYNLSRMRESATERYKGFHIPVNWMLDTGYVSQVKSHTHKS